MDPFTAEVREIALQAGADLVGFAPVERFDGGPAKTHPQVYMPSARAVVVLGISYPRAIGEVWGTYEQKGKLPTPYMLFGFAQLNWELSHVALHVAKALEAGGYLSLPMPPSYTLSRYRFWEELDETGRYLGDFSLKHAGLAAGLGMFGWSNILLTPQYGARQRLIAVITEAPLLPGDLYTGTPLCQPGRCGSSCVEICPAGALHRKERQEFEMEGRSFHYASLDHKRCRWCLDGFTPGSGSRTRIDPPEEITQAQLAEADAQRHIADRGLYAMAFIDFCGKCMHACPSPDF